MTSSGATRTTTTTEFNGSLLSVIFPWKITGEPTYIRLALSLLAPLPKPSFALVTDDSAGQWTLYMSEESFKFLDIAMMKTL